MCGITGFVQPGIDPNVATQTIKSMTKVLAHRGPDDSGHWLEGSRGLAFGHTRLAVVDVSKNGHQPMQSSSNRYTIVYNGEIYNHVKLRQELEMDHLHCWNGHSDTETLLAGFECWGVEQTIHKCKGMFAFAVYDAKNGELILGRDRLGEKPLYYGWSNGSFLFASELKSIKSFPGFRPEIDRDSIAMLLRFNYIPTPYSIYQHISKLQPGNLLVLTLNTQKLAQIEYWSLPAVIKNAKESPFQGTVDEAVEQLSTKLNATLELQMIADVPLGVFLSGGIDSSTIVALMQEQSTQPINTFSIGFGVDEFNEAVNARLVAEHLGTNHTELYVTSKMALEVIPKLPQLYDEPFADSSQIPTHLVAELAKQQVTVALSGDAGDELFCGYNRYLTTNKLWGKLKYLPIFIRKALSFLITLISPKTWDKIAKRSFLFSQIPQPGLKLHKAANALSSGSLHELYIRLVSHWPDPTEVVINSKEAALFKTELDQLALNDVEKMMALDTMTYLPDDILAKVERASMGVSLETRIPMLDHEIVEFAWSLPLGTKLSRGKSKWPLRAILYRHLPKELAERPKTGFAIPLDEWLRGPLLVWACSLLNEDKIKAQGYLKFEPIQQKWQEHLNGERNWATQLWSILMFQAWLEQEGNAL